jgi:hypothetical protein
MRSIHLSVGPLHVARSARPPSRSSSRLSFSFHGRTILLADYRSETDRVIQEFCCRYPAAVCFSLASRLRVYEPADQEVQDHDGWRRRQVADTDRRRTAAASDEVVVAPARLAPGDRGAHRPAHPRALRRDVRGHARPHRGPGLPPPPPPTASSPRSCAATWSASRTTCSATRRGRARTRCG